MHIGELDVLKRVAHEIYEKFPHREDRKLWVGDACPFTGNCPGHPNGSHAGKTKCDVNYYVLGDENRTQYGADSENPSIQVCDGNVVFPVFDIERNYYLIKRLHELTGSRRSRTCDAIKQCIYNSLDGQEQVNWYQIIMSDIGSLYRHNSHYHLELKGEERK